MISKRGKKTSSEKIVEVITAKVKNPDKSLRDIAKETDMSHSTVWDILKDELEEVLTSSDKKRDLLDVNLSILAKWKDIIEKETQPVEMATSDQIKRIEALVDALNIDQDQIEKWFKKVDVDEWNEMTVGQITGLTEVLIKKIEALNGGGKKWRLKID